MKVYCMECRRMMVVKQKWEGEDRVGFVCDIPESGNSFWGPYQERRVNPHVQNGDNDCKYWLSKKMKASHAKEK